MADAYFEEHPTDPEKVVLRKPRLDQGPDYERGFVDGMQYQMQSSVDKAVNRMAQPEQEPVTWGVDWGRAGQAPCVSIIKRLNDGRIEVVAVEYGPERTWVGLTDEEFEKMLNDAGFTRTDLLMIGSCVEQIVDLVEAKLKEKNT